MSPVAIGCDNTLPKPLNDVKTEMPKPSFSIRPYRPADAAALTELFYDAVESLAGVSYSASEVAAWAPRPIDYEIWRERFEQQRPWVAQANERPVGFISLDAGGLIDLAFVHSRYQRQGVGRALYTHLENTARSAGIASLTVFASHAARPLFERMGFELVEQNRVERRGCTLVNWRMQKRLESLARTSADRAGSETLLVE